MIDVPKECLQSDCSNCNNWTVVETLDDIIKLATKEFIYLFAVIPFDDILSGGIILITQDQILNPEEPLPPGNTPIGNVVSLPDGVVRLMAMSCDEQTIALAPLLGSIPMTCQSGAEEAMCIGFNIDAIGCDGEVLVIELTVKFKNVPPSGIAFRVYSLVDGEEEIIYSDTNPPGNGERSIVISAPADSGVNYLKAVLINAEGSVSQTQEGELPSCP